MRGTSKKGSIIRTANSRHQSFAVLIAIVTVVFTGALICQPPRVLRDDPQVLQMLERMQAAHNGIRPQHGIRSEPVSYSYPVEIQRNKAGAIREVYLYLEDEEFTVHNDFLERMTRLPSLEAPEKMLGKAPFPFCSPAETSVVTPPDRA